MESGSSEETGKQQSKGGRPKKLSKRTSVTGVRFNEAEYEIVQVKAKAARLKLTVYIRQMAVNGKVKPTLSLDQVNLMRQLAGMANNINQIAKRCHQEGSIRAVLYFEQYGKMIKDIIEKIER